MRVTWAAVALAVLPWTAHGQTGKLPDSFFGHWTVESVEGDDPSMLETTKTQLVGRRVDISPDRVALWTLWSGKPDTVSSRIARLDEMAVFQNPTEQEKRIGQEAYRFWSINLTDCRYHDKPTAQCVPIILAQDEKTNRLALYTNTLGVALLRKAGPPDAAKSKR